MACRTLCLAFENLFSTNGSILIEGSLGWLGGRYRQLVKMQSAELRGDQVRSIADVPKARCSRDGELSGIVKPRIEEPPSEVLAAVGRGIG